MAKIRWTHIPIIDADSQAYLWEYINAKLSDGEVTVPYVGRESIPRQNMAEVSIAILTEGQIITVCKSFRRTIRSLSSFVAIRNRPDPDPN